MVTNPACARDYYIDGTRPEGGDGRSWTTAWSHFAEIDWAAIAPGDTMKISGGAHGTVYGETLAVAHGGRPGAPIHIVAASEPGRLATPVITGDAIRKNGVVLDGVDYVDLSGLELRNHTEAGIVVRHAHAGVVIRDVTVVAGGPGYGDARGIDARANTGDPALVVTGLHYVTPENTPAQTDGVFSSDNDGVVLESSRITIRNRNTTGHSDGIQSFHDRNLLIRGNLIVQANTARTDNHGLWLSDTLPDGRILVCNNVILTPNLDADSAVTHWAEPGWHHSGRISILGNVIIGGRWSINLDGSPEPVVADNVLWPARGGIAIRLATIPTDRVLLRTNTSLPAARQPALRVRMREASRLARPFKDCGVGLPTFAQ